MTSLAATPPAIDLPRLQRRAIAAAAATLGALMAYALLRWLAGLAPPTPWVFRPALAVHLASVFVALPLGAFVLLAPKGGPRHRWLGRTWLALMAAAAVSSLFLRTINSGQFSPVHLFTLATFLALPPAILSARRGDIAAHRRHLRTFYVGALLVAGVTAFSPGRTMWQWAFASPEAPPASVAATRLTAARPAS